MTPSPYLSVIVTSRNDDHGGSMLRRMQTFVTCFINQCKRHGIDAELLVVEWNPPADRPPLVDALVWPDDLGPCQVRLIQVPPDIHARYPYSANLPLFQMIAKNYGIRRARGEFLLITNIDILLSDELCQFLASRQLRKGVLYRIDRTDVDTDVPAFAPVEEQLAYCRANHLRNNSILGTIQLNPDGTVWGGPVAHDGIRLGAGWCRIDPDRDDWFTWLTDAGAELIVPAGEGERYLWLDVQTGPSVRWGKATVRLVGPDGADVARHEVTAGAVLCVPLPPSSEPVALRVVVDGPFHPIPGDPRILPLRLYGARLFDHPEVRFLGPDGLPRDSKVLGRTGVKLLDGWDRVETEGPEAFVWARGPVGLEVPADPPAPYLILDVQVGPSFDWRQVAVRVLADGAEVGRFEATQRQGVSLPASAVAGKAIRLEPIGTPRPLKNDPRTLPFRVHGARWADRPDSRPDPEADARVVRAAGVSLLGGWDQVVAEGDEHFVWARGPAELEVGPAGGNYLTLDVQAGPSADWQRVAVRVLADGAEVGRFEVTARDRVCLPAAGLTGRVVRLEPVGADAPVPNDPRALPFRLYALRWADRPDYRPDPAADTRVLGETGLRLLDGWERVEAEGDEHFVWARGPAGVEVPADPPGAYLTLDLQAGPSAGWGRFTLQVVADGGEVLAKREVTARQGVCLPAATLAGRTVRLEPVGADAALPNDPRRLPFRLYAARWTDGYDPRPDPAADARVMGAAGVRLLDGWDRIEAEGDGHFVWARGPAELDLPPGNPDRHLWLDLQAGPSAGWKQLALRVVGPDGRVTAERTVTTRQPVCITTPPAGGVVRLEPVGADAALPNDPRRLPFRLYAARWTDGYDPRPDPAADARVMGAAGVRLLDGWDRIEAEGDGHFVWALGPAEFAVPAGPPGRFLTFDLQAGPSAGWGRLRVRAVTGAGEVLADRSLWGRQPICLPVPPAGGVVRLEPVGADVEVPGDVRRLPFRVFAARWADRYDPRPDPAADRSVLKAEGVRLLDGWGLPQVGPDGPMVLAFDPPELAVDVRPGDRDRPSLALSLEAGAGADGRPIEVQIVDGQGRVLAAGPIEGRTTFFLDRLPAPDGTCRLRVEPADPAALGGERAGQPLVALRSAVWVPGPLARRMTRGVRKVRSLVGRVRRLIHPAAAAEPFAEPVAVLAPPATVEPDRPAVPEPAAPPPQAASAGLPSADPLDFDADPVVVPECVARGRVPVRYVCPPLLHLNACGDFHLLDRETCFAVRGYAEFPIYSLNIDSLFSFNVWAAGVPEVVLQPPMYAYHIEHAKGTGATPEGIDELLARMRRRGIPVLEFKRVSDWATEMRNAGGPILFNDDSWGLPGVELPEMSPGGRRDRG